MISELQIVQYFNQFGLNTFIDSFTIFISQIPFLSILWLICGILVLVFDKKRGKFVFLTLIIATILDLIISEGIFKHLIPDIFHRLLRLRPWEQAQSIVPLGKHYIDSSFPSGHMSSTLAALTTLSYYYRKAIPFAVIFAILMAFARLHNGMHFPSDILAGSIFGIIYGLIAIKLVAKYLKTLINSHPGFFSVLSRKIML